MVKDVPANKGVTGTTWSNVGADLISAPAHSRSVHNCVTDERTVVAWQALGGYVCHNCQLSYTNLHHCEGLPSQTTTPPPGRGRARACARPEGSTPPLGTVTPLPKRQVITPRPNWTPLGYRYQPATHRLLLPAPARYTGQSP